MATITSIAVPALQLRSVDVGVYGITGKAQVPAAAVGDAIVLFTAPHAMRIHYSSVKVINGLGANAVVQARKNNGAGGTAFITGTSNQGVFSVIRSDQQGGADLNAGDTIELLVSGAPVTGGPIEYDFLCSRA